MTSTHIAGIAYDESHAKELRFIRDVAVYSARIRMLARQASPGANPASAQVKGAGSRPESASGPAPLLSLKGRWPFVSRRVVS